MEREDESLDSLLGRRRPYAQLDSAAPESRTPPQPRGGAAESAELVARPARARLNIRDLDADVSSVLAQLSVDEPATGRPEADVLRVSRAVQLRRAAWAGPGALRTELNTRGWRWQTLWRLLGAAVANPALVQPHQHWGLTFTIMGLKSQAAPVEKLRVRLLSPGALRIANLFLDYEKNADLRLFLQRRLGHLYILGESQNRGFVVRPRDPSRPLTLPHQQLLCGTVLYYALSKVLQLWGEAEVIVDGNGVYAAQVHSEAHWLSTWRHLLTLSPDEVNQAGGLSALFEESQGRYYPHPTQWVAAEWPAKIAQQVPLMFQNVAQTLQMCERYGRQLRGSARPNEFGYQACRWEWQTGRDWQVSEFWWKLSPSGHLHLSGLVFAYPEVGNRYYSLMRELNAVAFLVGAQTSCSGEDGLYEYSAMLPASVSLHEAVSGGQFESTLDQMLGGLLILFLMRVERFRLGAESTELPCGPAIWAS